MIRVFSVVIPGRVFTLFMSEIVLLFGCYVAAASVDPDVGDLVYFLQYDGGLLRIAIVCAFVLAGLFFRNLYAQVRLRSRLELFQNLSLIFGIAFLGQGLISYLYRDLITPRKIMLAGSTLALVCLFGWRLLFDTVSRNVASAARVLFVGMSPTAAKISAHFDLHPEIGLTAMGYLGSEQVAWAAGVPRLGSLADFGHVVDEHAPECIVIGRRDDIRPWWVDEFLALRFGGVRIEEASTLYETVFARKCVTEMWPSRLIFANALEPPPTNFTLQTLYSQIIAVTALVVTLPVMLAAAAMIRMGSAGPVLERQRRTGMHDKPFNMFGFRCRTGSGEATAAGRLLMRLRLASLPRLFNVVRGEMAIVGPRPEHPVYASRLSEEVPFYRQRHRVKPGLTGWADVNLRQLGLPEKDTLCELEYDLYYVENLSPMLDSFILLLALRA